MKVLRQWLGLSRKAVHVPSLEVFRVRFDEALGSLILEGGNPACGRGLELSDLEGSFRSMPF